ncbi:response regulator [Paracoccus sp. 1_MG-2023]|uniref:response regulator n=1 Tax=unclassified Paracoccus (in: a-proteobacteria) TaxID=2688777 RepID=UPI001C08A7B3|nr:MULTISPECIES: response regulator [unclassified Paracoccus (in: a-proteobacteria)]MBU2956564.1 response regulator [Paracoccus sp. C2R09]MDO6668670.1 response regulator [Paracoccus sp. 1_MG-2023]
MPDRPIRFLIVDDIAENIAALEALLRRDGLVVDQARSAAEALELMLVHDYALAFLDVQMPGTDGYELAELMRATERTRGVPIIFVTAAEMDEARRFRGYEAGAVDYIFKPIDPLILKSKAEVFYRIGRQAKDLLRQRDEMQAIARHRDQVAAQLRAHVDNSPLAFVALSPELQVRAWSKGAERAFGRSAADMLSQSARQLGWLDEDGARQLTEWLEAADEEAPRFSTELMLDHADIGPIPCEVYGSVLNDGSGSPSLSLQILDITERKQAEEVRSLLIGELNHRIKNTLANVQAISRQSLRQASSLPDFEQSFGGRLQALARAHSILSDATWASAPLDQLIDDQVSSGTLDGDRLHRDGPSVELTPETMLRLALTLHELGTNAAKYGALSVPDGQVYLNWQLDGPRLTLIWREEGGPPVHAPSGSGFGTTLITAVGGGDPRAVSVEWRPEGVIWTIRLADGVRPQQCAEREPAPEAAPMHHRAQTLSESRILLVEDEPLVALDLRHELEDAGAEVVGIARTVPEALEMAGQVQVDLAILDGNLKGQPVDEVADLLSRGGVRFCFLSGYGREHLPQGHGAAPLIEKPFRPDHLRSVLNDLLAEPRATAAE